MRDSILKETLLQVQADICHPSVGNACFVRSDTLVQASCSLGAWLCISYNSYELQSEWYSIHVFMKKKYSLDPLDPCNCLFMLLKSVDIKLTRAYNISA